MKQYLSRHTVLLYFAFVSIFVTACRSTEGWQGKNEELLKKYGLSAIATDFIPETGIEPSLEIGQIKSVDSLKTQEIHPGVSAKVFWNAGAMTAMLNLEPNAIIPEEMLPADRLYLVMEGSVEQMINETATNMQAIAREEPDGTHGGTPVTPLVYQQKGTKTVTKAGANGAKILEVYSPVRLDYLQKLGIQNIPENTVEAAGNITPNVEANRIYNLYDLPLAAVAENVFSRIISAGKLQIAFTAIDPLTELSPKAQVSEMLEIVTRGGGTMMTLGEDKGVNKGDLTYLPTNLVGSLKADSVGMDLLEVIWPAKEEIAQLAANAAAAYQSIIPLGAKPELLIDGSKSKPTLIFTEGPKWFNNKVYFSNMYFDQGFGASPQKSSTVEMDVNGNYRNITQGQMQTNGLYPYKNGNLIVCDMMGHRVVEMTTSGKVVKVLADKYDGKSIDGPNDVITDTKGGFYFTDPQFTMEPEKFQPGRAVYYVSPDGAVKRVTEPNEFAMPNGILLSKDGKTLFINNCYDDESWFPVKSEKDNFLWAYDVSEDGSISNGRKFAKLLLPDNVLDRKGRSSSADGMAMDMDGNIYIATYLGVQIFDAKGNFVGIINLPSFPVSLCFGGEDMKTLFIVSFNKVYKIPTNKVGYVNYL